VSVKKPVLSWSLEKEGWEASVYSWAPKRARGSFKKESGSSSPYFFHPRIVSSECLLIRAQALLTRTLSKSSARRCITLGVEKHPNANTYFTTTWTAQTRRRRGGVGEGRERGRPAKSKLGRHFDSRLEILPLIFGRFSRRGWGWGARPKTFSCLPLSRPERAPTSSTRGNTRWEIASRYSRALFLPYPLHLPRAKNFAERVGKNGRSFGCQKSVPAPWDQGLAPGSEIPPPGPGSGDQSRDKTGPLVDQHPPSNPYPTSNWGRGAGCGARGGGEGRKPPPKSTLAGFNESWQIRRVSQKIYSTLIQF
jgi:hypothetical protein